MNEEKRCPWCLSSPEMLRYHDEEWGARQCHDDRALFEFLTLEMMQCGLSWATVLAKREAMRAAFDNFEPAVLAAYSEAQLAALLEAPGIIHSARKLSGMVRNARAFVRIQAREGSFDRWFWAFTKGQTVRYPTAPLRPRKPRCPSGSARRSGKRASASWGPSSCTASCRRWAW